MTMLWTKVNCKYYSCDEFFNHDNSNSFNLLHSNVNGFLGHSDNINEFIAHEKKTEFDAICITETSLNEDSTIPDDALPDNYKTFSTGTLTSKGGTIILAKKSLDCFERDDLNVQNIEFESTWIEIKCKNSKNIVP